MLNHSDPDHTVNVWPWSTVFAKANVSKCISFYGQIIQTLYNIKSPHKCNISTNPWKSAIQQPNYTDQTEPCQIWMGVKEHKHSFCVKYSFFKLHTISHRKPQLLSKHACTFTVKEPLSPNLLPILSPREYTVLEKFTELHVHPLSKRI